MKKLYLTLAAALLSIGSMAARELVFYVGDTPVKPDETVKFTNIEVTPVGGGASEVIMDPQLSLWTDIYSNTIRLTAKCTSGQSISMCAGGACESNNEITKNGVEVKSNQKLNLQFEYTDMVEADQAVPEVVTEFTAVDVNRPATEKKFTLVMNPSAGVATIITDKANFRAVAGGIQYSFDAPTAVALYSITGQKALATTLNGNGTLSTANLPAGIYVYTLNGKSGKLYIR